MAGPEEPPEAVAGTARDDVQVDVRHALTDDFVQGKKGPLGPECLFLCRGHSPPDVQQRSQKGLGGFSQSGVVGAGDDQRVAIENGSVIQEGHEIRLVDDDMGGDAAVDDAVKNASLRGDEITLCLAYERHPPRPRPARDRTA